jgi:sigma-B regulation protein RsbU (phosphoserine phosphatase)
MADRDLMMATAIQAGVLPHDFPPFPERNEFDLYASMDPAKEVGGDFYDFFLTDDDHLCMMIADVSGKGIPAAMFMMLAKSIIVNNVMLGKDPARTLEDANSIICTNNKEHMFVTVWLGILEISTGRLIAANGGHEYPMVMEPGGSFALFKYKHGFVVGGRPRKKYSSYEMILRPGSKLFVYTDGITEANNEANELFGKERLTDCLNIAKDEPPQKILEQVRKAVDEFAAGAEQFDDLTMLCIEYKGVPE